MAPVEVERGVAVQPRWTTEVYYKGFRILLTMPFKNAEEAVGLMNDLSKQGFTSAANIEPQALPQPEENEASKENVTPICAVHNKSMVQRKGQYGMFWACPVKEGGLWCKYRPPKR
jgi:hypothetical protein